MKRAFSATICLVATWTFATSLAQAGSGLYLSGDLGANFASGPDLDSRDNDRPSACDEFANPLAASESLTGSDLLVQTEAGCTDPMKRGDSWMSEFDAAEGLLAGAALGYSLRDRFPHPLLGRFRLELEYFYRNSEFDQTADIRAGAGGGGSIADKLAGGIVQAEDRIDSISSHQLFGNLYFDFFNASRFTPYVGFGVGVGFTDIDFEEVWVRNSNPTYIREGEGWSNAAAIRRNLAGTVTSEQAELSDTLFGYQVLFGLDYALTESLALGLKGRWVHFDTFRDGGSWDRLRSHDSQLRLDGSEPVAYQVRTDDLEFFGLSLNLKYHF